MRRCLRGTRRKQKTSLATSHSFGLLCRATLDTTLFIPRTTSPQLTYMNLHEGRYQASFSQSPANRIILFPTNFLLNRKEKQRKKEKKRKSERKINREEREQEREKAEEEGRPQDSILLL